MTVARKIRHAFRGQVSAPAALLEIGRRGSVALRRRYERLARSFEKDVSHAARLRPEFARLTPPELLDHFRTRSTPRFFAGFQLAPETLARLQRTHFSAEGNRLLESARNIANEHRWPLLGYSELAFGEEIDWQREPVSGLRWPLEYYADLNSIRAGSGDVRLLWELNRLGHLITLGRAFVMSGEESFAEEFFVQVQSWKNQNQFGFGPNWSCAMEVALRAMNLLTAFQLFRGARSLTEAPLRMMLALFEQHGEYIRRHLEFSYIATSNHYLTDVVGLLWLGICLPELQRASVWQEIGLREMLREMDKQILSDGADYESSTGYHRFVLELFLFSFILCRANSIEIADKYQQKLWSMLEYLRAYLRPDGRAPLIGDTDSGQVMPIVRHAADDHGYLLGIGAAFFNEQEFKIEARPPEELFWLLGEEALRAFSQLETTGLRGAKSAGFAEAGLYVLRDNDLYLVFNAGGTGLNGRGAHGHNDALSVEVSACGASFLSDPGTYVYTSNLGERHLFRSTGYHSTVEVDAHEQNTIEENTPFIIGDEARPRVLRYDSRAERDLVIAEHYGYKRLRTGPITHRRAVSFDKRERYWLIEDALTGSGTHLFRFCFHLAPGLERRVLSHALVEICDSGSEARLFIAALALNEQVTFEPRWLSRDYGAKLPSVAACWTLRAEAPVVVRWLLLPVCSGDDEGSRLQLVEQLKTAPIGNLQSAIRNWQRQSEI